MVDILVKNAFLLTMQGKGVGMIEDGAVAVEGNKIVGVGKTNEIQKSHGRGDVEINAKNKAILPGLIDAHIHSSWAILRGQAQDVPEIEWKHKTIDPFEEFMTEEASVIGSRLGVLEGLKNGTTTFGDYCDFMDRIAEEVYLPIGARGNLCSVINEIGPGSTTDLGPGDLYAFDHEVGEKTLNENLSLIEKWHDKAEGRITCLFGPHATDMMSLELLQKINSLSEEYNLPMHFHVAQGEREAAQVRKRYGMRTIEFLDKNNLLSDRVLAVHCHATNDSELQTLANSGARMLSCQTAIALIDGIVPPLHTYLSLGGMAALGTDQACGNNCHSMFREMKIATLLNKTKHTDPTVLPSWKMLRLVTTEAAKCLQLDNKIGSLEEGKLADLIIVNLRVPHLIPILTRPVRNIAPNLVYSATGEEVETVIINGEIVVENRKLITMDEEKILQEAQEKAVEITSLASDIYERAGSQLVNQMREGLL